MQKRSSIGAKYKSYYNAEKADSLLSRSFLERKTGFEPATSTLARSRSTN